MELNRPSTKQSLNNFWGQFFKKRLNNFRGNDQKWIGYRKRCNGDNGGASYDETCFDSFGVEHILKQIKSIINIKIKNKN